MPPAVSRFPTPEIADLPADLRERILAVQEKSGFVPNVFLALARRPDEFRAFFAYHDALMEKPGGLSKAEREMIVVATSGANDCLYCVVAHGAILRIRAKQPAARRASRVNHRKAEITARQQRHARFRAQGRHPQRRNRRRGLRDARAATASPTTRPGTSPRSRRCSRCPTASPTPSAFDPTTSSTPWGDERYLLSTASVCSIAEAGIRKRPLNGD